MLVLIMKSPHGSEVSDGYTFTIAQALVNDLNCIVTEEALEWMSSRPTILKVSELIFRLVEDIKSHNFEQERGQIPSIVECYMKEYGVLKQEAYEELNKQVDNSLKDVNEERLKLSDHLPRPLLMCMVYFSRATNLIYDEDDKFTRIGKQMQARIASLLINPVAI
ncbi:hypothetical protein Ddye_023351 [Dipteronia dyeriana]|uniref:Terpene synthase metal-binding domain-containing protein n=1 Tax=Dipteronia dyeriana TaxID=168575 RepID=A0AAD9TTT0_9ROSI|nr:hypothetical protein Ddye_023351 [Dipteronia dyeriana]